MGASSSTPSGEGNTRATPHLTPMEQAMCKRLMEEFPQLDQLMAETVVWKYFKDMPEERTTTEQLFHTHATCSRETASRETASQETVTSPSPMEPSPMEPMGATNAHPSGTPPASASSPPPTSGAPPSYPHGKTVAPPSPMGRCAGRPSAS